MPTTPVDDENEKKKLGPRARNVCYANERGKRRATRRGSVERKREREGMERKRGGKKKRKKKREAESSPGG